MKISDLIQDGSFESGNLEVWPGKNACIIESPNVRGGFAALLSPSKLASSFISQIVNVVPLESYQVSLSLAKDGSGFSEAVQIYLEYLDNELNEIEGLGLGLDITVQDKELPNGKEGTFKVIEETTEVVPLNGRFARLTIERVAGSVSGVIIDQVSFLRASEVRVIEIPKFYVANTGEDTVTVFTQGLPQSIDVVNSPQAMLYLKVSGEERVYVAGELGVSVIDVSTDTVTTTIDIPGTPREATIAYNRNILASSDRATLYLANTDSLSVGYVTVIDTATNTVTENIVVSSGNISPVPLALTSPTGPNPNLLFVGVSNGSSTNGNLVVIDTTTNTVKSRVEVEAEPLNLLILPSEEIVVIGYRSPRRTYGLYDITSGTVSTQDYDLSTDYKVRTESLALSLLTGAFFIGYEICQPSLYSIFGSGINAYNNNTFSVIAESFQTIGSYGATASKDAKFPNTLAQVLSGDGTTECIYVNARSDSSASGIQQFLFNGKSISAITFVSTPNNSGFLTLSSDSEFILTSFNDSNTVEVIDATTLESIIKVTTGDSPVVIVDIPSDSNQSELEK